MIYSTIWMQIPLKTGDMYVTLHDRTIAEAEQIARDFGYVEPKWYNIFADKLQMNLYKNVNDLTAYKM